MPDLEQPVGHPVPVVQQVIIGGDAEVGQIHDRQVLARRCHDQRGPGRQVLKLHLDALVAELVQVRRRREIVVRLAVAGHSRHPLRAPAEQLTGEHVQQRGLVDRLDRVAPEQLVTPVDQGIDVAHHNCLLVGHRAEPGDHVGHERVVAPLGDLRGDLRVVGVDEQLLDPRLLVVSVGGLVERLGDPVPLRRLGAFGVRRIEDPAEPLQRLLEPLVGRELATDQEWDVEKQLPVVDRHGAGPGEVQDIVLGLRSCRSHPGDRAVRGERECVAWREVLRGELDPAVDQTVRAAAVELALEQRNVGMGERFKCEALPGHRGAGVYAHLLGGRGHHI